MALTKQQRQLRKWARSRQSFRTKITCETEYVVGIYQVKDCKYMYYNSTFNTWTDDLQSASTYPDSIYCVGIKLPSKDSKLFISKVFAKKLADFNKAGRKVGERNLKITLTNPNYYEKLSAVVNNI